VRQASLTLNRGVGPSGKPDCRLPRIVVFRLEATRTSTTRSAQFNLFPLLSEIYLLRTLQIDFHQFLARLPLSHTVKELVSRGLKSRSGGSHRDRRSVSRPPSVVAAREASCPTPSPSIHFVKFLEVFSNIDAIHWFLSLFLTILDGLMPVSSLFFSFRGLRIGRNASHKSHGSKIGRLRRGGIKAAGAE
jgi:hypothetical protein